MGYIIIAKLPLGFLHTLRFYFMQSRWHDGPCFIDIITIFCNRRIRPILQIEDVIKHGSSAEHADRFKLRPDLYWQLNSPVFLRYLATSNSGPRAFNGGIESSDARELCVERKYVHACVFMRVWCAHLRAHTRVYCSCEYSYVKYVDADI